jgi:hypothetical protein
MRRTRLCPLNPGVTNEKVPLGGKRKEKGEESVSLGFVSYKCYKRKDGKKKKIKKVIYYETESLMLPSTSSSGESTPRSATNKRRLNQTIFYPISITLAFLTIRLLPYYRLHLENYHILMLKTILGGATK